jgi:hypothetical protein
MQEISLRVHEMVRTLNHERQCEMGGGGAAFMTSRGGGGGATQAVPTQASSDTGYSNL